MHERLLRALRTSIYTLIGRAVLHVVDSAPGCQTLQVQVLADETQDGVEHVEPYGFTSNPLPGAEGVVLNVGGRRGAAVGFNFGNRSFRAVGLKSGEVCIYTDEGDKITLMRERHMRVKTLHLEIDADEDATITTKKYTVNASEGVAYNTPSYQLGSEGGGCAAQMNADLAIKGNTTQDGTITSTGDQIAAGVSTAHHTHPGDSGGTTGAPNA